MDDEVINTYELSPHEVWIKCLRCKRVSFNQNDVAHRYCGYCKVFHDDIWPPARRSWLEQGKKIT